MTTEIGRLTSTMQGYQRAITQAEDALNTLHQCYSRDKRILLILQIQDTLVSTVALVEGV